MGTIVEEVETGEDILNALDNCLDCLNDSKTKREDIDEDEMYLVTKEIGFTERHNKSGLFITNIIHLDEKYFEEHL